MLAFLTPFTHGTMGIRVLALALVSASAMANPCSVINLNLSENRKKILAPVLARKMTLESVEVLESYRYGGWQIIYVDTIVSDGAFLFFKGNPLKMQYKTFWAGEAFSYEEQIVKTWALKNAKGIPEKLASCFAWHVTQNRSQ